MELRKVAQSPPEPSIHRSAVHVSPHSGDTHRGEETLSDTFQGSYKSFSLASIPKSESLSFRHEANAESTSDIRHLTSEIKLNFGLINPDQDMGAGEVTSGLQPAPVPVLPSGQFNSGREALSQSTEAQSLASPVLSEVEACVLCLASSNKLASPSPALIYGELINPDSLGPLQLEVVPYFFSENSPYKRTQMDLVLEDGEFFDGIVNPMVKKFSAKLNLSERPGYFSIYIQSRPILEKYIAYPGDSLKLSLDLMKMDVLFAGPQSTFYEAQYAIQRERKRREFSYPRMMITSRSSSFFQNPDNIQKMESFNQNFGSELLVLEPGKESLDFLMEELRTGMDLIQPQLQVLENYSSQLSDEQIQLLQTEIWSGFYGPLLTTFRKFHLPILNSRFSPEDQKRYLDEMAVHLSKIKEFGFSEKSQLISANFLMLALESTILKAIWNKNSFYDQVEEEWEGEIADRLRSGFLSNYLSTFPNPDKVLNQYISNTRQSPWKDRIESLIQSHIPGEPILPITLMGLNNQKVTEKDLIGQPAVLYFYFSTCSHSAKFFREKLYPLYQETKNLGYQLIPISVDDDQALWKARLEQYSDSGLPNYNLRDESKSKWVNHYEIQTYPKAILIDKEGKIQSFNIRNLGKDYHSFKSGFIQLYESKIQNTKPNSSPAF